MQEKITNFQSEDVLARMEEAEATIRALKAGEVDAFVVDSPLGPRVYTLEGADHPYRVFVEQIHEGTVTIDREGVILYANGHFAAMVGTAVEAITASPFERWVAPYATNSFAELCEAASVRGHGHGDMDLLDARRQVVPVRVCLTLIDVAGMQTTCMVVSDLRGERQNEAILREEQLSRLMLEQAGEAIVVIDPAGVIARRSESARVLAGGPVLLSHFDLAYPVTDARGPVTSAKLFAAVRDGQRIQGVHVQMQSCGVERSLLLSAGPLWSKSNEFLGCVVTLTDITERQRAQEALHRQAEELTRLNSDLTQFAYSASHDLREPLRQVTAFSELLQASCQDRLDSRAMQLIKHTVDGAHRAETLLQGLLDYVQAAGAPLEMMACDANAILRATLGTLRDQIAEAGARVDCEPLPRLRINETHLVQLFQNLIGNALKYRSEAPPVIRIGAGREGKMWKLSVADNGIGIAPAHHDQIFGLFQRLHSRSKSGSGLGLAICQKIVQRYGGKIWVESDVGAGATFFVILPDNLRENA